MEALAAVWGVDNARSLRWRFRNEWAMMGEPVGMADGRLLNAFTSPR